MDSSRTDLRADASENHEIYGFYGISVFAALGDHSVESLAASKLRRAQVLVVFRAGDLVSAGLELRDTRQEPHYDVVDDELDVLLGRLLTSPNTLENNPHFEAAE